VDLIAEGLINKEIAFRLHLNLGTIKQYLNKVFAKLGTTNRVEVAVWSVKKRYGITE
jgi:DNA-binding NarL/FixJ family response regulator